MGRWAGGLTLREYGGATEGISRAAGSAASSPAIDDAGCSSARRQVRVVTTISTLLPEVPAGGVPAVADGPGSAVRLSLKPEARFRGRLDGAWWPRSRDMAQELPSLVTVLDRTWGRITRVTVHEDVWPDLPPTVPVGVHVVRLGWFGPEQERDDLCLFSYKVGRWDLLVVPPECDPARAARLLAAAADVHETRGSAALLADPSLG